MEMRRYTGSCHCGAVEFSFRSQTIVDGMRCNCSICKRKGAIMTSFTIPPEDIGIRTEDNVLSTYQFGENIAKHHFCSRCGIFTFVQTRLNPGEYRVNLGCIEEVNSQAVPVALYDGSTL